MSKEINVLKAITDMFVSEYIPAVLLEKNEKNNIPADMVSVLYSEYGNGDGEVNVDLFFLPVQNASEDVKYYATVINIAEEISPDYKEDLIHVVSILNFLTPFGTYVISPDGDALSYKMVTPVRGGLPENELIEEVNLLTANALDMAERYVGVLQKFVNGKANIKDIAGLVGGL